MGSSDDGYNGRPHALPYGTASVGRNTPGNDRTISLPYSDAVTLDMARDRFACQEAMLDE